MKPKQEQPDDIQSSALGVKFDIQIGIDLIKHQLADEKHQQLLLQQLQPESQLQRRTATSPKRWGEVRASPYGSCLDKFQDGRDVEGWTRWRSENLEPLQVPREGYDHVYGQSTIQRIDSTNLGDVGPASAAMTIKQETEEKIEQTYDFGSAKTPDDAPVGSLRDKWRLLPHFLKLRSLMRQHINSFDHFVNVEMKQIVQSPSAREIRSDHDPNFYLRYTDCWVGEPSVEEDSYASTKASPFQCRLRDCTYSAPIYVNVRYTRGRQIVVKRNVVIGRMPIMLRSQKCMLRDATEAQLAKMKECPYDPGGYFIVKGVEKVILIQEQLSKNRVILELDPKGEVQASITSSTHERKSKAYIGIKNGKVGLRSNIFGEDIPIAVALKAMGIESDMEAVQLIGSEPMILDALALSLEEPSRLGISTKLQALRYIGTKIRRTNTTFQRKPLSPEDEARDVLDRVVLSHVPVHKYDFRQKAIYVAHITRRVLMVHLKQEPLDDKDYYGNKRLELAGNLLSLLFEDLFKIFSKDLKRQADMVLSKQNRAQAYDVVKSIRSDTITNGMNNAISTGNWVLKRFRMDRAGVTQVLSRLSYMSALGMMTRINSQFEKTRKVSGPRSLQASQWGMLCLHPGTTVLLDDGSVISLNELQRTSTTPGVVVVDPHTHKAEASSVEAFQSFFTSEYKRRVLRITTMTGRSIIATEDHAFAVPKGTAFGGKFTLAGNLKRGSEVLLRPTPVCCASESTSGETIISAQEYIDAVADSQVVTKQTAKLDAAELTEAGLLPLKLDHPCLSVLVKLIGYSMTNGNITHGIEFYMRSKEDGDELTAAVARLGYGSATPGQWVNIERQHSRSDAEEKTSCVRWRLGINGPLARLLFALGVTPGKKNEVRFLVPGFVLKGSVQIKSAFISSVFGSDGSALNFNIGSKIAGLSTWLMNPPTLSINTKQTRIESLKQFYSDIKQMLASFDIGTTEMFEKRRKGDFTDGKIAFTTLSFSVVRSYSDVLKFVDKIGYSWCREKSNKSGIYGEYIRYYQKITMDTEDKQRHTTKVYNPDQNSAGITGVFGVSEFTDESPLPSMENILGHETQLYGDIMTISQFLSASRADFNHGTLYVQIDTVREVPLVECPIVLDLTTVSDVHTFVTNGFVTHNCPADTPEGEACGLVKNLALLAHITTDEENGTQPIERLCRDLGVEDVLRLTGHEINSRQAYLVLLNGLIIGVHTRPNELVRNLRTMRRRGLCGEFVSFYLHTGQRAVHIATDGGRVSRPLIIVDEVTGLPRLKQHHVEALALGIMTVNDLLQQGIVEYVDCNEENNTLIAVTERALEVARQQGLENQRMRYTHLEIDPFTILGVVGGVIPYPHHNQAPRNTYTVAMSKQAMGTIGVNEYERMDGLIYTLVYPQKPMVKSRTLDMVNFDKIPGGQNSVIAVMSYSAYDIEDAVVLSKAGIDRGFGRCMVFRKYQTSVRRYANGSMDRTCGPPDPSGFTDGEDDKRFAKFRPLDQDGICMVGEKMESGYAMVNKESPTDTTSNLGGADMGINMGLSSVNIQYKPSGMSYRGAAPCHVDKVLITSNANEQFLIKVMLRQVRRPEIGDKFASRHGQKGVCGLIVQQQDLPFNDFGFSPDLIMNPHGFPSRMTVGKLLELLVGKAGLFDGRQGYSSAFGEEHGSADTAEATSEALMRNGLNYGGKDILYSGASGEPMDAYIFSGPVFYQKLKHMVLDKAHARARGPRAVLTRQPTEGRSRDGGLRLGEMERDCLIAYGAANLIMERLMHSSDAFSATVCLTCGLIQYQNWCQYCRSGEKVADIRLPYACKLLFQELQSMNVLPRLRLKDA